MPDFTLQNYNFADRHEKQCCMIYLKSFDLPSNDIESEFFRRDTFPTYHATLYPFQVFPQKGLSHIDFDDITIFSGGNGSGKSTLLNVMCENLGLKREAPFNKTALYDDYVAFTEGQMAQLPREEMRSMMDVSRIITSDDVFNHILDVRDRNDKIDFKRQVILEQRMQYRSDPSARVREIDFDNEESVGRYREYAEMSRKNLSASGYVKKHLGFNERTYSNGENGFKYFTDAIQPGGLYLLDEPENSLAAELQTELADFLLGMARAYRCQFIISSHSPFILSIPFAKIYDMDSFPVRTCRWTALPNIRLYHDFFKDHESEF